MHDMTFDMHFYFIFDILANWLLMSVKTKNYFFHMMWLWLVRTATYEAFCFKFE